MIVIERTVDLSKPISTETLRGNEFTGEAMAHRFVIHVTQDGEAITLTGTISAYFLQANGASQDITGSTLCGLTDDGAAWVSLPSECYGVPGRFHLAIYHGSGSDTTCIYSCVGSVVNSIGDPQYDPGNAISNLTQLITQANTAANNAQSALVQATAVVSYADQSSEAHTDAQKAKARTNIGAASKADVGFEPLAWAGFGLITMSGGIGSTVSLTPGTSSATKYLITDCSAGDRFTVFGHGALAARLYGFIDSSNKLLLVSAEHDYRDGYVVTTPAGAAKAIFHNTTTGGFTIRTIYKGVITPDMLPQLVSESASRTPEYAWQDGAISTSGLVDNAKNKRSTCLTFNPGERMIITNSRKDISIAVYAVLGDTYEVVGQTVNTDNAFTQGGARFEFTDWTRSYRIRLAPFSGDTRPNPDSGGYISVEIIADRQPYAKNRYTNCNHPVIGFRRTYSNVKPLLTFQAKTISGSGIADSSTDCLVTLPNTGWVEVKQDINRIKFKIAKVTTGGTINFPVDTWSYYTYRFQGDAKSAYYALVENTDNAESGSSPVNNARESLGVYLYTDEGMNYGNTGRYLEGKHIAFIGDSITQGRFDNDGVSGLETTTAKPFGALVAEVAGDDNYGNFGIGAALVSGNDWKSLLTNCSKVTGYDIVFVCGGTNDYGGNVSSSDFSTAYTTVTETLMANNTEVILVTPLYRENKKGANTQSLWLADYATAIKTIGSTEGLKVIDLLRLTGDANMTRFMPDGLHPDERGHRVIADWIISECDRLAGY